MPKKHERTEEKSNKRSTKTARGPNTDDAVSTSAGSTSSSSSSSSSSSHVQDDTPASLAASHAQRWNIFINEFSKACPFVGDVTNYCVYEKNVLKLITTLSNNADGISLEWLNNIFLNIVDNLNSIRMTDEQLTLLLKLVENMTAKLLKVDRLIVEVMDIIILFYLLSRCITEDNKDELYNKLCESSKLNECAFTPKIMVRILMDFPLTKYDICDAEKIIGSLSIEDRITLAPLWVFSVFHNRSPKLTSALARNEKISSNPKLDEGLPWLAFQMAALYDNSEFYRAVFVFQPHDMPSIKKLYFKAISCNKAIIIKQLVAIYPALLDAKDSDGCNLLHIAAKNGYLPLVNYFLDLTSKSQNAQNIANVQNVSKEAASMFKRYALFSSKEMIYATRAEARINAFNDNGDTALHLAASAGRLEMVKFLINAGAKVNVKNDKGYSPLHLAALNWRYDVIIEIISSTPFYGPANIDVQLTELLFWAAENGHLELVHELVHAQVALNSTSCTVLYRAAKAGQTQIVKYLISVVGYLLLKVKDNSPMPLHAAAANGHLEVVKLLIEAGADPLKRGPYGYTALHHATESGHQNVVEYLFESYDFCNEPRTTSRETILHLAAKYGHLELVKLFLASGANIALETLPGKTAFSIAAEKGHLHIIMYLIDFIRVLNWMPEQKHNCIRSAFNFALINRQLKVAEKMFELDATVLSDFTKIRDKVFYSLSGRKETIMLLIKIGVNAYELSKSYRIYKESCSVLYELLLTGIAVIDTHEIHQGLVRGLKSMLRNVRSTNVDVSQLSLVGMLLFSSSDFQRQVIPGPTNEKLSKSLANDSQKIGFPPYIDAFGNNQLDMALQGKETAIQFLARMPEPKQTIFVNSLLQLADILNDKNPKKAALITLHGRLVAMRKTIANMLVEPEISQTVTCSSSSSAMFANPGPSSAAASSNLSIHESVGTSSTPSSSLPAGPSVTVSSSNSLFTRHASGAASSSSSSSESSSSISSSSSFPRESSPSLPSRT